LIIEDDGGVHSPLTPNEKYDLNREIGLLSQLPKQELPEAFKRISAMLNNYYERVKDRAKLNRVRHYLDNYGK